eukprot:1553338-Rhodomonas_salina.2
MGQEGRTSYVLPTRCPVLRWRMRLPDASSSTGRRLPFAYSRLQTAPYAPPRRLLFALFGHACLQLRHHLIYPDVKNISTSRLLGVRSIALTSGFVDCCRFDVGFCGLQIGVRALERIPKGVAVCEYVGELVSRTEGRRTHPLHSRIRYSRIMHRHYTAGS